MIANWLDEIEDRVRAVIEEGGSRLSARELGGRLGVSEESAVSFIGLLASSGRLVIERVSLPEGTLGCQDRHETSALMKAA